MMKVVGIDLGGVETRPTGFCVLDNKSVTTSVLYSDREIIQRVVKAKPGVVAIDAPLSLPKGRESLEKRSDVHLRECDRELLRMKIKFFPITLGPMRKLTERGIKIKNVLEKKGFEVIEVYPGAAQDIWKIPRKQNGLGKLRKGLEKLGIKGLNDSMTGDELDAITSALVGELFLEKLHTALGNKDEGLMIIPRV